MKEQGYLELGRQLKDGFLSEGDEESMESLREVTAVLRTDRWRQGGNKEND